MDSRMASHSAQAPMMRKDDDGVTMTTDLGAARLFPAWHGPAKVWVSGRGAAYEYGVFAVTPTALVFSSARGVVFRVPRHATDVRWPWWSARIIAHLRTPNGEAHAIAFGRPFADAVGGDAASTGAAVDFLGVAGVLPTGGQRFLQGAAVVGDLVALAATLTDLTSGRRRAAAARTALATPPTAPRAA